MAGRRDPRARPHHDLRATDEERGLEGIDDAATQPDGLRDVRAGRGQYGELIATQPRGEVLGADLMADALRDGDEELIADGMPQRVVDDLEVVEVEE